jgi:hypothetical protein
MSLWDKIVMLRSRRQPDPSSPLCTSLAGSETEERRHCAPYSSLIFESIPTERFVAENISPESGGFAGIENCLIVTSKRSRIALRPYQLRHFYRRNIVISEEMLESCFSYPADPNLKGGEPCG